MGFNHPKELAVSDTITIHDLLKKVKDTDENVYFHELRKRRQPELISGTKLMLNDRHLGMRT